MQLSDVALAVAVFAFVVAMMTYFQARRDYKNVKAANDMLEAYHAEQREIDEAFDKIREKLAKGEPVEDHEWPQAEMGEDGILRIKTDHKLKGGE